MHLGAHGYELATWMSQMLKGHLTVPGVALGFTLVSALWLLAGLSLRGLLLAAWLLVPALLAVAGVAVAGPGRLFSKKNHEGDAILTLTPDNAVTTLDLFGLCCFLLALGLAVALIYVRHRRYIGRN
ncbi:MAG TPA: hypothetical protein VKZ96_00145 [Thermomicrobiales bacterium]|nr:hypothetical protein [Thermomicrobiales bacterium]